MVFRHVQHSWGSHSPNTDSNLGFWLLITQDSAMFVLGGGLKEDVAQTSWVVSAPLGRKDFLWLASCTDSFALQVSCFAQSLGIANLLGKGKQTSVPTSVI